MIPIEATSKGNNIKSDWPDANAPADPAKATAATIEPT